MFLRGTGSYLPPHILTNQELSTNLDTSDDWIKERVGIEERRIATTETVAEMAARALEVALQDADLDPEALDVIIVASNTVEERMPSAAAEVQHMVGATNAYGFDISSACTGFLMALNTCYGLIKTSSAKRIAVIGVDKMSSILDWSDRSTCVLFGDGAGATIFEYDEMSMDDLFYAVLHTNGALAPILYTEENILKMQGKEVFRHAVENMTQSIKNSLGYCNLEVTDLDLIIPHQANQRIISALSQNLHIPEEKIVSCLKKIGNTAAASIPIAMDYAKNLRMLENGMIVALPAAGAGFTWGCIVLKI